MGINLYDLPDDILDRLFIPYYKEMFSLVLEDIKKINYTGNPYFYIDFYNGKVKSVMFI
jgi:hypothetical protein